MKVLVVGLGVIGTTYGFLFQQAGHEIEHLLRPGSPKTGISELNVDNPTFVNAQIVRFISS